LVAEGNMEFIGMRNKEHKSKMDAYTRLDTDSIIYILLQKVTPSTADSYLTPAV
jgi:hypothetical protein